MDGKLHLYELLADLLRYPDAAWSARLAACRRALAGPAAEHVSHLEEGTRALSLEEREELHMRTFDCNPTCALEVGWHLFGESYDRGAFLVWMREQLQTYGLPESAELPDHLTHVLPLLARLPGPDADRFATECVLVAVQRILAGFAGKDNPHEHGLRAIETTLTARHGPARTEAVPLPVALPYDAELGRADEVCV